jgi:protein-S-isoprenylcysteine O-methyltransferase Ste14
MPTRASFSAYSFVASLGGTFSALMLRPSGAVSDIFIGQVLQVIGYSFAIFALLSLSRSFGILPADRGVRTHGAYRFVRHPIYAAYLVHHIGYLISNFTLYNLFFVILTNFFQVLRIYDEEKFLSLSPEYRQFKEHTRWRLIPFVF